MILMPSYRQQSNEHYLHHKERPLLHDVTSRSILPRLVLNIPVLRYIIIVSLLLLLADVHVF